MRIVILLALILTACGESLDLGVVSVEPETKACYDTSVTVKGWVAIRNIDTLECRTGSGVTKWAWE